MRTRQRGQPPTKVQDCEKHYVHRPLIMELILWLMWLLDLPLLLVVLLGVFDSELLLLVFVVVGVADAAAAVG